MRAGMVVGMMLMAGALGCEASTNAPATGARLSAESPPAAAPPGEAPAAIGDQQAPAAIDQPAAQPSSYAPPTDQAHPSSAPGADPIGGEPPSAPAAGRPAEANAASGQPSAAPPPAERRPLREAARPGVGVKGASLDSGVIQGPAKAYFQARERVAFLQVDQALQLFRATEGRLPQSHAEFMQKVIQFNNIQLPQLPPGARYVWDPQQGELMVERPQ